MNLYGIEVPVKNSPKLDPEFIPILKFNRAFLAGAKKPISIAVERANGEMASCQTYIYGTPDKREADHYYVNRLVKTILWVKGGYKIYVSGDEDTYEYLKSAYAIDGVQAFDNDFMSGVYEHPFEVVLVDQVPPANDSPKRIGGHLDGCRIGFDAGGSDRKVTALLDGETVFDEEVVWFPKVNSDPEYHYQGIVDGLKSAAARLPRVDAVGVSTAGVVINDCPMNASLFIQVPKELQRAKVKNIYIRAIQDTFGDIPYSVINDGDISALAGAMSLEENSVLGIAMGTSEAGGFVDENGCITGWLNELAFVPVDGAPTAMVDEWSGDIGCGAKYFSQDSVIKLAPRAGIELDESLSPAEKLKVVQAKMLEGDPAAADIYTSIGTYLGHTLAYYYDMYHCKHVLLQGRVMSGKGGDLILAEANRVLADEYPECAGKIFPTLPDEKFRRLGQSAAAASLPEIQK
ncbi:MAG: ROK family protein [Oscillospiraceae bacterium]|nr:ROK family protein [Oscillospiraceae bacterium]